MYDKKKICHEWYLHLPSTNMMVLSNGEGDVAIIYNDKNFGDTQSLLLHVTESAVKIISVPHYINDIEITLEKNIIITLSEFAKEFENQED